MNTMTLSDRMKTYIETRTLEAAQHLAAFEAAMNDVNLIENMLLDSEANTIEAELESIEEPVIQPTTRKPQGYYPQPKRRKWPFLDWKVGDSKFIPHIKANRIGGTLSHARNVTGGRYQTRRVTEKGFAGIRVTRTA